MSDLQTTSTEHTELHAIVNDGLYDVQTILRCTYNMMNNRNHINSMAVIRSLRLLITARLTIQRDEDGVYTLRATTDKNNYTHLVPLGSDRDQVYNNTEPRLKTTWFNSTIGTEREGDMYPDDEHYTCVPLFPHAKYATFQDITWVLDPNSMFSRQDMRDMIIDVCDVYDGNPPTFTQHPVQPMAIAFDGSFGHDHVVVPVMPNIDVQAFGDICIQPHIDFFKKINIMPPV